MTKYWQVRDSSEKPSVCYLQEVGLSGKYVDPPFRFYHLNTMMSAVLNSACYTWGFHVLRYPNFFSGMAADRNVKVVGGDVAVL